MTNAQQALHVSPYLLELTSVAQWADAQRSIDLIVWLLTDLEAETYPGPKPIGISREIIGGVRRVFKAARKSTT